MSLKYLATHTGSEIRSSEFLQAHIFSLQQLIPEHQKNIRQYIVSLVKNLSRIYPCPPYCNPNSYNSLNLPKSCSLIDQTLTAKFPLKKHLDRCKSCFQDIPTVFIISNYQSVVNEKSVFQILTILWAQFQSQCFKRSPGSQFTSLSI